MPDLLENLSDPMEAAKAIEAQVLRDLDELRPSALPAEPESDLKPETNSPPESQDEAETTVPRELSSSFPPQHLPTIGSFGDYDVVGRLALGGMAEVLLAREKLADGHVRYVALKRILEPHDDNESFVRMFLDEASVVGQLDHPHIARQYDRGEVDGRHFMVLEWVNGVSLGKFIRRARERGVVSAAAIAEIVARVADALHYAHDRTSARGDPLGIVHRDVSPHNIMISYQGEVKLIDFGIVQASTIEARQRDGVVKGKFAYMAPEQCLGLSVDRRADVFALGICLWEAIAQRTLFLRRDALETMRAVTEEPVVSLSARLPPGLEGVASVASRALEKKTTRRYDTAAQVRDELREVLKEANRSVTTESLGALMQSLFRAECGEGPAVDTHPFGSSYHDGIPGVPDVESFRALVDATPDQDDSTDTSPGVPPRVSGTRELSADATDSVRLEFEARPNRYPSQPTKPFVVLRPPRRGRGKVVLWSVAAMSGMALVALAWIFGGQSMGETPAVEVSAPSEAAPPSAYVEPTVGSGRLTVGTDPAGLVVMLGERSLGRTPIEAAQVPVGESTFIVEHPDGTRSEHTAYVPPGETIRVFYRISDTP